MTVLEMLTRDENENGNLMFLIGAKVFLPSDIGSTETYASVCGGAYEGLYQWATHNINDIIQSENKKYMGWTIITVGELFDNTTKVYIPKWVLNIEIGNGWGHANNLFKKYLKVA